MNEKCPYCEQLNKEVDNLTFTELKIGKYYQKVVFSAHYCPYYGKILKKYENPKTHYWES